MLLIPFREFIIKQLPCLGHLVRMHLGIVSHLRDVVFLALCVQLVQVLHFLQVLLRLARVL